MAPNQIAFYPQSSGGGGGAMQLAVPTITADGTVGTYTLSAIPQTFTNLLLIVSGTNTSGSSPQNVSAQFSADTGANYNFNYILNSAGTGTFNNVLYNQTSMFLGKLHNAGSGMLRAFIGSYSTALAKPVELGGFWTNPGFDYNNVVLGGVWGNSTAITSIKLTLASGNFSAGSKISLYGIQ